MPAIVPIAVKVDSGREVSMVVAMEEVVARGEEEVAIVHPINANCHL